MSYCYLLTYRSDDDFYTKEELVSHVGSVLTLKDTFFFTDFSILDYAKRLNFLVIKVDKSLAHIYNSHLDYKSSTAYLTEIPTFSTSMIDVLIQACAYTDCFYPSSMWKHDDGHVVRREIVSPSEDIPYTYFS